MKSTFVSLTLLFSLCFTVDAKNKFIVYFTDKGNNEFKASDLTTALSSIAIEKRKSRGLGFDHYDLPVNADYLKKLESAKIDIISTSRWLNAALIETELDAAAIKSISPYVYSLHRLSSKIYVQRKFEDELSEKNVISTEPKIVQKTTSNIDYGAVTDENMLLGIDYLHDKGYTGKGILVAFLDGGFNDFNIAKGFDSLRARNGVKGTFNFCDNTSNVYQKGFHGSYCSADVVGNIPGTFVGMAPGVDVLLAITEDETKETHQEEFNYVAAVEWAEANGADIISASLSYKTFDAGEGDYDFQDMDGKTTICSKGARIAAAKGIILVSGAGNSGFLSTPGDADSILCVGGTDHNKKYDRISSHGPSADGRIKPDVATQTRNSATLKIDGTVEFSSYNGTSTSTPKIAGFAACLKQAHPNANNYQIIQAIKISGDHYTKPDSLTGYGVPNAGEADRALWNILNTAEPFPDKNQVNLYPNPASNMVYVEGKELIKSITLTSLTGQVVYHSTPNRMVSVVDLSAIPVGNYIATIQTEKGSVSRMLTKQ